MRMCEVVVWQAMWRTPPHCEQRWPWLMSWATSLSELWRSGSSVSHFHLPIVAAAHPFCFVASKCWRGKCKERWGFVAVWLLAQMLVHPDSQVRLIFPQKRRVASQCSCRTGHLPSHCWICKPRQSCCCWRKKYDQVHTSPIYFQVRKRIGHSGVLEAHQGMGVVCDTHNILYFPAFNNEGERTDRIVWLPSNNPPSFDLCSKRRFSVMAWALKSARPQTV